MTFTGATPLADAIEKMDAKTPVASVLRTAEWEQIPLALRERSLFSAGVNDADFLSTVQTKLRSALTLEREKLAGGRTAYVDRSSFIGDMRKQVLEAGTSDGTDSITDIASRKRLGLIYDVQIQQAQNFARWKTDQDPDVLDAFPAQELIRVEDRTLKRDWTRRWHDAGGRIYDFRMIALKDDPVWMKISRFQTPWPPFDFGSGMGVRDISRKEAEELGLLDPGEPVEPSEAGFNDALQASVSNLDPDVTKEVVKLFGDLIEISGNVIKWVGSAA